MTPPPGEYLADELEARGWSTGHLAQIMGVPEEEVAGFIRGDLRLVAAGAENLGLALGTSAQFWINLQKAYEKENQA